MTKEEAKKVESKYMPYEHAENRMSIVHSIESGEVIVVVFNPNVRGITRLKDLLTLKAETINNLVLYFRTRSEEQLDKLLATFRTLK